MVQSRRTWNLGATPSLRGLWRVGRAPEPELGMARPAPASPAARPFPHTGPGRLRTGRGKDTLAGGDEDSSARSAARPALAQCRALSVDCTGPGSPRRLYLSVQPALQDKGCKNKSQGTKEEKLLKRQAPAPKRDREAQEAGGTMNVEKTGGRLFGSGRCSSLSGPPGAAPVVHRMVEAMSQLQEEKARLQEELAALREKLALHDSDQTATSTQLQNQVENLKERLISQAQEVSRLRSELGGTDLEKHRDLLMVENEQLRQEMRRCEAELQELRAKPAAPCTGCEHSQESAQLRDKLSQLQLEVAENKGVLSELNLEVQQKTNRLAEVELRLKDCLAEKAQEEERLSRRLRDSHETIASLRAQSPPVRYVIKTVEVESSKTKQALSESQARNQHLQEQVAMQRQVLKEVQEKASDWEYTITVSVAEIYNEVLRDLLGQEPQEKLEIRLCPDGSGQLYVPGLTEFQVQSVDDINKVFEFGHTNRTTEFTNLNEHSSRSHALLIVTVRGVDCSTGLRTTGKLNLVDLAGSERVGKSGAEGSRLREAQHINKSLSALGDVIAALRSRQGHVPFRNSKLTYLLQDSLSGDSKTLMVVQVSPVEKNTSETLYSLKFAERVRSVELGPGSRRAELASWSSQEHLEWEPACQTPQPSARAHSAPSSGTTSRPGSIRRRLQPLA
ncbi:kinesin family member C3 [Rhinolophus ferrumequinum]|uniref:Kinesin-like protein n=1 Tax=Rhinolophus ferrumequinum TaxID=59479 RepID=A0A7J7SJ41_RHIFE|nr:kinesin family member C3 [Rhinolophus ferrumequinum]